MLGELSQGNMLLYMWVFIFCVQIVANFGQNVYPDFKPFLDQEKTTSRFQKF